MPKTFCFYCLDRHSKLHQTDEECGYSNLPDRVMSEEEARQMVSKRIIRFQEQLYKLKRDMGCLEKSAWKEFGPPPGLK